MNALELYTNHRVLLQKELEVFKLQYKGDQPELIEALADKIHHMCEQLGSPSSVLPMLKSIIKGKIKYWSHSWDDHGRQLNPRIHRAELERKHCDFKHNKIEGTDGTEDSHYKAELEQENFVKGHFRWNRGNGYIANFYTRDYIEAFYVNNNVNEFNETITLSEGGFRFQIASAQPVKHSENTYSVEIITLTGNDYRYHYYPKGDRVTTNFRNSEDPITETEINYVKNLINKQYKTNF